MAVIVNGDGILTGISSLATALTDITSGRGTITGVTTVGTLQLGAGVSISSPRTQNAAIFTNNSEFLTVDDAGRVGVGTVTPNSDAHPQNVGKINVGFITAKSIAGDIDARNVVVAGVSTFTSDVFFSGASSKTITFDQSEGHIRYLDNAKAQFGTQGDLQLYHTGSHSFIEHSGTGHLILGGVPNGNNVDIMKAGYSEYMARFKPDSSVDLYYDANVRFQTTPSGADVTGTLNVTGISTFTDDVTFTGATYNVSWDKSVNSLIFTDNAKAVFGTGSDLEIKHTGSHSQIIHSGTGNVFLDSIGGSVNLRAGDNAGGVHNSVVCNLDAGVDLYHNNTLKLSTTSSGVTVQNGNLALNRQDTGNEGGEIVFNRASDNANQWFNDVYGNDSSARIRWHHGGSEKVSFITDGGITFNGDTATANALDDYEEGSWTPTSRNDGSFTSSTGRYVKIGQQVTVYGFIPTVTNNTSNNILQCSGLPYTVTSSGHTEFVGPLMIRFLNATGLTGVSFNVYTASGRDYLEFFACRDDDNNYEAVKHSDLAYTNSNGIRFSISYTV